MKITLNQKLKSMFKKKDVFNALDVSKTLISSILKHSLLVVNE